MTLSTTGIVATSRKENEHRLPVHPRHLERIPAACRPHLRFERGYGQRFGVADDAIAPYCGGMLDRRAILEQCDVVILPKPLPEDLAEITEGKTLWGWPHCVQQREITQKAIDRRLTLLAFEAMFNWSRDGKKGIHVFAKNNELAGYCSVLHALELLGTDGHYGPPRKVALLGFGSVNRGAIFALRGRGFTDFTVYTQRPPHLVRNQLFGSRHRQMRLRAGGKGMEAVYADGHTTSLVEALGEADLIVNGTLQDTDRPLSFVDDRDLGYLRRNALIIDVSCDEGMGFSFARPTSFEEPIFGVDLGHGTATYYGVDHSPTYLWDSASWEISASLLPYLEAVMAGRAAWRTEQALERAVEIEAGEIKNEKILSFQGRSQSSGVS